ncbi:MAG: lipopolysaccharide biosynthesis protein [Polaromonas sp.]|nr:lipopolysaccharide biosynthesis protein [Polaromonas sp.]
MEEIQPPLSGTVEEIGLLDLLVTLAENVKLLIIGPLIVGLCALGIGFVLPQTFQSVAVLQAEQAMATLMTTAAVLDPVVAALGLAKEETAEEARSTLREQIKTTVGRNDKLLTLTVSASMPQQAQAIANAVLKQTYLQSRPKANARARLETQLAEARERLKNAQDASAGLLKRLESNGAGVNSGAELARGYAELLNATGAAQSQIVGLEAQLEGLSEAQLVQAPTLPEKASKPKKALLAIGATLGAGLLLLLFIFMRQALRNTAADMQAVGKLARIRRALGLK